MNTSLLGIIYYVCTTNTPVHHRAVKKLLPTSFHQLQMNDCVMNLYQNASDVCSVFVVVNL